MDCPRSSSAGTPSRSSKRDDKVLEQLKIDGAVLSHIQADIKAAEKELDDDAESIITNERYVYIASLLKGLLQKEEPGRPHHLGQDR